MPFSITLPPIFGRLFENSCRIKCRNNRAWMTDQILSCPGGEGTLPAIMELFRVTADDEPRVEHVDAFDDAWAPRMFRVTITELVLMAGVVHLHTQAEPFVLWLLCLAGLVACQPFHWVELFASGRAGRPGLGWYLAYCILPPLRLMHRDVKTRRQVWLPRAGWIRVHPEEFYRVQNVLGMPLMVVSLAILPLAAADFLIPIEQQPTWLKFLVNVSTGCVWFAFAAEFFVMLSLTNRKVGYITAHWLDLAIIVLPLMMFVHASAIGGLLRLQQFTKLGRVYRLRNIGMRMSRTLMLTSAVRRMMSSASHRRLIQLEEEFADRIYHLKKLRQEIDRVSSELDLAGERRAA